MAILKHLTSKNADYGKALEYLIFQHNEQTQKMIRDKNHNKVLRREFYLDGINCDPYSFELECKQLNAFYRKNQDPGDIKSHHYILSFDPRDATESGLTGEQAQKLGLEFARKFFDGHQTIVCTHMDGHNQSGNIHVHIVLNSLRKLDVDQQDWMDREIDSKAGYKHHQTRALLTSMQKELMEICEREALHQMDLLSPSQNHVTDREYRLQQREQKKLNQLNAQILEDGMEPAMTEFQTQKQFLRDAITDVSITARCSEEFFSGMQQKYGIHVKDYRKRYSYLHPDRKRYISDRALGQNYTKGALLEKFAENEKASHQKDSVKDRKHSEDTQINAHRDPIAVLYYHSHLRLVTDLQANLIAQQNATYARKVKLSNLKEMAKTVMYVQEHGFDTQEELKDHRDSVNLQVSTLQQKLNETTGEIKHVNEQIHYTGQYLSTKSVQASFLKSRNKKRFYSDHRDELERYRTSVHYFKEQYDGKIPSMKVLRNKRDDLIRHKNEQRDELKEKRIELRELNTACRNVELILGTKEIKKDNGISRDKNPELS